MTRSAARIATAALVLGAVAGMRSMSAPALLSTHLARESRRRRASRAERLFAARRTARMFSLLAAGEMVADKTPFVPNRTEPMALAGRIASGALVGGMLAMRFGRPWPVNAALGASSAIGAAFGAYYARRALVRRLGASDLLVALLEDGLVLLGGSGVIRSLLPRQR